MKDLRSELTEIIAWMFHQLRQSWRWHVRQRRKGPTISHGWVPPDTP